jgi:ribonuclease HI
MEWDNAKPNQAQTSNYQSESNIWSKLWKIEAPPKQIHLLWRIIHNALPVKTNLLAKGILCDSVCPRCNKGPENSNHTFLHCDWARLVWFHCPLTISTSNSLTHSFADWLIYMIQNASQHCLQIIATITYTIWLARNSKNFQKKDIPAIDAVDCAMKCLSDYHHHLIEDRLQNSNKHNSNSQNSKCWSPPPLNSLKLNVDAHLTSDGRWGFGWILRGSDGRCAGAGSRVCQGSNDVDLAEVTGLHEALHFVESAHLSNTIIEMDAEKIVNAVQKRSFPRTSWGQLARSCSRVCDQLGNVTVKWVSRQGNQAAHVLARWALTEPDKFWPNNFPFCILDHIQKDMGNVT